MWGWLILLTALTIPANADIVRLPGSHQGVEESWKDQWLGQGNKKLPQYLNRLVLSGSAYLKQHADNPIDWYPWADAAFARAIKENKLIFLSIGYASCHWCHVMEAESFADPEVAAVLNRQFVSIKVDREQHPDIDAYYNLVVETIKGESGWPVTLVLLPDLKPVLAANYLDKERLLTALGRLGTYWQEQPDSLRQNATLLLTEVEQRRQRRINTSVLSDKHWVSDAEQNLLNDIDPVHGGFGRTNKFPSELKLQFLLNQYKQNKSDDLRDTLVKQLDVIMHGGLSDVVDGGIFRYTTDREMSRPHFEKMLYNQALVVSLFADAANWLGEKRYARFARSIIEFAKKRLRLANGSYAAAVDADHDGREGGYYLWPESMSDNLPTGIRKTPVGHGLHYFYGYSDSDSHKRWRKKLQDNRDGTPRIIDNQVTAWNALWLSALLQSGDVHEARNLAENIWRSAWDQGILYRLGKQPGFLDDYSYLSDALWQLYLKTVDASWKNRARILDRKMLEMFFTDGVMTYRSRAMDARFQVDLYQDRELPSPVAIVLKTFAYHQTELEFVEAHEILQAAVKDAVGRRAEHYLSVIQVGNSIFETPEQVIASGHGMISLRPVMQTGQWQIAIDLDENWHINAAVVHDASLVATRVSGQDVVEVAYPDGHPLRADFSDETLNVYSGRVKIGVSASTDRQPIHLRVRLQACSSNLCLLPENVRLLGLPRVMSVEK